MQPYLADSDMQLYYGDAREVVRELPEASVHMIATSPPFWNLRDYGIEAQIGLEPTPEQYVSQLVDVFREAKRVLRPDGTLWIEMGDSYAHERSYQVPDNKVGDVGNSLPSRVPAGMKSKDLIGTPFMLAFALRADGWFWRSCLIWEKPNALPESTRDRCTTGHSYILMFAQARSYFFAADAIAEPAEWERWGKQTVPKYEGTATASGWMQEKTKEELGQNMLKRPRSVWRIPTGSYPEAHFATWPEALVRRMLLAGCPQGGVVLDPFAGSGTTLAVARKLGLRSIGIDISCEYCHLIEERTRQQSLLA